MRVSSYVDLILMKILRTRQIEDLHGATLVSEGIDANLSGCDVGRLGHRQLQLDQTNKAIIHYTDELRQNPLAIRRIRA
mgnify:CR=1 FL=1